MPEKNFQLNERNISIVREIGKHMPGGFFIYRAKQPEELLYANEAVFDIFGCDDLEDFKRLTGYTFRGMLHPLDYEKDRAPRIAVGADGEGRPVFVWAEGKGKNGYEAGRDSCGASLSEMCRILQDLGVPNAVSLDGGGSAQIEYEGKRYLKISDRDFATGEESERPIPMGIVIR